MHSHAVRLKDPKRSSQVVISEQLRELAQTFEKHPVTLRRANFEHSNPWTLPSPELQQTAYAPIQRDQRSLLHRAGFEEHLIVDALKILLAHSGYVVACRPKKLGACAADIFVELELHAGSGMGRIVSRAASAP